MILAIDPGLQKCGLAVMDGESRVLEKKVIERVRLESEVVGLVAKYRMDTIVIGGGTAAKSVQRELSRIDLYCNIVFTDEKFSTLEARRKYWREHSLRGLLRFVPTSLLPPPGPIDDYAAVVLGERYLKG